MYSSGLKASGLIETCCNTVGVLKYVGIIIIIIYYYSFIVVIIGIYYYCT